ncbi:unnamed protein product [Rotaria sp. Silwood1]|nr:unnamed protein product [Rotaria sp. Silwood1]
MTSTNMKQICAKCNKGGGIAMCHGCQQLFCTKHFVEYRQELSQQIDQIGQEHDLLRQDLSREENIDSFLVRIDQWEQESIKTIQICAQNARTTFQQLHNQTKNELKISFDKLTQEIRDYRESYDYTEIDYDNNITSAVKLIKVTGPQHSLLSSTKEERLNENNNCTHVQMIVSPSEKFNESFGDIESSTDGLSGRCLSSRWDDSCISGMGCYSSKIYCIRFRIESRTSNCWFFGIITASEKLTSSITERKSACAWWKVGYSIVGGTQKGRDLTRIMKSGDEVTLILDCDNRLIQLQHHYTNALVGIQIDLE